MKEIKDFVVAISATEPIIIIEVQEHEKKMASPKLGQILTVLVTFVYTARRMLKTTISCLKKNHL